MSNKNYFPKKKEILTERNKNNKLIINCQTISQTNFENIEENKKIDNI